MKAARYALSVLLIFSIIPVLWPSEHHASSVIEGAEAIDNGSNRPITNEEMPPAAPRPNARKDSSVRQAQEDGQTEPSKWRDPITWFTLALVFVGAGQWYVYWKQKGVMEKALHASELAANAARASADAAISTYVPVLMPFVTDMSNLHPLTEKGGPVEFESGIQLAFENLGKTTAVVREVRAKLFLTKLAETPNISIDSLPKHEHDEVVPGETIRGKADGWRAWIQIKEKFVLSQSDFAELLSDATRPHQRFGLLTYVVYDDIFGNRHKSRAWIKMRIFPMATKGTVGAFQTPRGGARYNYTTREKIPETDDKN